MQIPTELKPAMNLLGQHKLEEIVLADDPPLMGDIRLKLNEQTRLSGGRFAQGQEDVRDQLAALGRHRLGDVMTATSIVDILDPLMQIAKKLDVDLGPVFDRGAEALEPLIAAMPSRWVERELRRARQSNPQKRWEANDLNDVIALSIAVPYCDVVVTERSWTGITNTRRINQPFQTKVIRDLRELPSLLADDSAT